MGDCPQFSSLYQLIGVLHQRCPAIVEADKAQHAGRLGQPGDLGRLLWRPADRLLAEDMLPGRGRLPGDLQVQEIGGGDIHDLHVRMGDHLAPIRRAGVETKELLRP